MKIALSPMHSRTLLLTLALLLVSTLFGPHARANPAQEECGDCYATTTMVPEFILPPCVASWSVTLLSRRDGHCEEDRSGDCTPWDACSWYASIEVQSVPLDDCDWSIRRCARVGVNENEPPVCTEMASGTANSLSIPHHEERECGETSTIDVHADGVRVGSFHFHCSECV